LGDEGVLLLSGHKHGAKPSEEEVEDTRPVPGQYV